MTQALPQNAGRHISSVTITDISETYRTELVKKDREAALRDLTETGFFQPAKDQNAPYRIALSIQENRLIVEIANSKNETLPTLILSLKPYKRLIQDYFMIVSSYEEALKDGKPSRIEAIDMGRKALHNEGAELLIDRLESKISLDLATARRIFTLICVLHEGKALQWR